MALPMDLNVFKHSLPEMVRLNDLGRMVIGVCPTSAFGTLHPAMTLPEGKAGLSQNDFLRVKVKGENAPLNGRWVRRFQNQSECSFAGEISQVDFKGRRKKL